MAQGTNMQMELAIRKEIMESVRPVFDCMICKAFPTIESVKLTFVNADSCACFDRVEPKCRNGHDTGKPLTISFLDGDEVHWQTKLLSTIPHPCKNEKYGCQKIAMLEELPSHEEICDYRKVDCVDSSCAADVCFLNYMVHFNKYHLKLSPALNSSKIKTGLYSMNAELRFLDIEAPKLYHFVAFDQTFFEISHFQNDFVYRWVVLLGFKEEAEKYYYQAFIANPNNVNDKRIFSGQVRSMDETRRDVIAEQNCFIIGKATCKNFKNDHDTIDYKIELRNLKEEAKDEDEESGISEEETSLSSGVVSGP